MIIDRVDGGAFRVLLWSEDAELLARVCHSAADGESEIENRPRSSRR